MSGKHGHVAPMSQGWYNKLRGAQRDRVDLAVRRALNACPTLDELAERTGIGRRVLTALRRHEATITETHLRALAPMIGTTMEAVLAGTGKSAA